MATNPVGRGPMAGRGSPSTSSARIAPRRLPHRRASESVVFELDGVRVTATVSRFDDDGLAELFLKAGKPGNAVVVAAHDGAIAVSIALQHGADVASLRHAMTRLHDGSAAGPIGRALELFEAAPTFTQKGIAVPLRRLPALIDALKTEAERKGLFGKDAMAA
jgi:hypothetical protein